MVQLWKGIAMPTTLHGDTTPQNKLESIHECLGSVFSSNPPSLRTFNEWRKLGYYPYVKVGKRVFLNPEKVKAALEKKFTIKAID